MPAAAASVRTALPDGPIYTAFQREVAAARDGARPNPPRPGRPCHRLSRRYCAQPTPPPAAAPEQRARAPGVEAAAGADRSPASALGGDMPAARGGAGGGAGRGRGGAGDASQHTRLLQRALASVQHRVRVVEAERDQVRLWPRAGALRAQMPSLPRADRTRAPPPPLRPSSPPSYPEKPDAPSTPRPADAPRRRAADACAARALTARRGARSCGGSETTSGRPRSDSLSHSRRPRPRRPARRPRAPPAGPRCTPRGRAARRRRARHPRRVRTSLGSAVSALSLRSVLL